MPALFFFSSVFANFGFHSFVFLKEDEQGQIQVDSVDSGPGGDKGRWESGDWRREGDMLGYR